MSHDTDPSLALWFTPEAIREHFDDDEEEFSDADLAVIGQEALLDDRLYRVFHEVLVAALERHRRDQ